MAFEKGKSGNPAGKPKGAINKLNADLKEMALQALEMAGGAKYLFKQSKENPVAFLALISKLLPKDVNVNATLLTKSEPVPEFNRWIAGVISARPADEGKDSLPH